MNSQFLDKFIKDLLLFLLLAIGIHWKRW